MKQFLACFLLMICINCVAQTDTVILQNLNLLSIRAYTKEPITKTDIVKDKIKSDFHGSDAGVLLRTTPNIIMYSDGANENGYMYYRIRGLDQTRINHTLDGVPLNEPEDQGVYFSNYTDFLSNINSIQIQRGAGISTNGNASYGGSINFESNNLFDSSYQNLDLTLASFNTKRISLGINNTVKNSFGSYFRVSNVKSDGYREHSGTDAQSFFTSLGYYKNKFSIKYNGFIGFSKNQMAYLGSIDSVLKINRKDNPLTSFENDNFLQQFNSLSFNYKTKKSLTNLTFYYNKLKGNYDVLFLSDLNNYQLSSNYLGFFINEQISFKNLKINLGSHNSFYERTHSSSIYPDVTNIFYKNKGIKRENSLFFKALYSLNKTYFYGDIQYKNSSFEYKKSFPYTLDLDKYNWNFLNYRLGVTYQFKPNVKTYGYFGNIFREPTRNDLFAGFDDLDSSNYSLISNFSNVKAEQVKDIEIGSEYNNKNFRLKLLLYGMYFKNEIAAIGQLSYIGLPLRKNVDKSRRTGIEFEGSYKHKGFFITSNLSFNSAKIKAYETEYDNKIYNNIVPLLTPKFLLNSSLGYNYNKLFLFELKFRFISPSYLDNENTEKLPENVDFSVNSKFRVLKQNITLGVNNLFNRLNYNSGYVIAGSKYYYVAPTTNYYINLNINL